MLVRVPKCSLDQRGFTLIELVIIIVTVGILAAVAIPRFTGISDSAKETATKEELLHLKRAIVGNPQIISGGQYIDRGFLGDVGFVPSQLRDLVTKPDSVQSYNKLTRLGWNGPYLDSSGGEYLSDAWGNAYVYVPSGRRIKSTMDGSDSIVVTF